MRAGDMPFLIEAQEVIAGRNSVGEATKEYCYRGRFWCAIEPLQGEERYGGGARSTHSPDKQAKAVVDVKITARGDAAPYLKPTMRLVYRSGSRIFDIDSIIDLKSAGITKVIYCKEVA